MSEYINKLFSLEGKVAVVIGGTGELCGAMAEGLAGAGAEVVLAGRSEEKARCRLARIDAVGGRGWFQACDVAVRGSLDQLRRAVVERSGRIDILVNGAGVNSATPFLEIEEDELDRLLDVNLKAVFRAAQVFGSYFLEQGQGGSVINIGSVSGILPLSRVFTYSMTKAAVHNLTRNLAREWATAGIRVNTLVPGFFPAEQNRRVLTDDRIARIMEHTPMKRFGEAAELVGATLLLASSTGGSFLTGQELVVDGGFTAQTI